MLKIRNLFECNANPTSLPAAECVIKNEKQNKKSIQNFLVKKNWIPAYEGLTCTRKNIENQQSIECNANSTSLPATECVKKTGYLPTKA